MSEKKYGKSFGDLNSLKQNFFNNNDGMLKMADGMADIINAQPVRKTCKICGFPLRHEERIQPDSSDASKPAEIQVQVRNILSPDRVVFISQTSKHDALVELADVLATAPQVKDGPELTQEILKREELMSTAIGRGIAIPHVRLSSVTDLVMAVGVCKKPIADFQTLDDQPVNLLFMIAAAYNQHSYYLKTISHFSAKFKDKDLRDAMLSSLNEQEVFNLLIKA